MSVDPKRQATERFRVLRLDEVDGYADEGRLRWHMIRTMLGIESFGINAWAQRRPARSS